MGRFVQGDGKDDGQCVQCHGLNQVSDVHKGFLKKI
jgi:mono/diheme cytochrome c family protein